MNYLQEILDDDEKIKEIVSDVSSFFEAELHDSAWFALYRLGELIHDCKADLIGSSELSEVLRIAELIRTAAIRRAEADAIAEEDAAIEASNQVASEIAWFKQETRNYA